MADVRVGIDIDGILASFEHGYAPLVTKHTGIEFPRVGQPDWPEVWDWELAAGMKKDRQSAVWAEIKADPTFWLKLPAHRGADEFLFNLKNDLSNDIDVYFVTNRMGLEVKWQTEQWLRYHGFKNPTVLISRHKAACCRALDLTHYLDDKQENCEDVLVNSPSTRGFMLARPYNREILAVPRLANLDEFLKVLMEAKHASKSK